MYKENNNIIHIACTINQEYIPHFGVMLYSLFVNNPEESFHVYLVIDAIDSKSKKKIQKMFAEYQSQISFVVFDEGLAKTFPLSAHAKPANYFRLFLTDLLPATLHKVLYLDCDMIIKTSILELWQHNIDDYYIGAVDDIGVNHTEYLGMKSRKYFNSGMMLINLDRWRSSELKHKSLSFIDSFEGNLAYWDQDVLNKVIDGEWFDLEMKWNVQASFYNAPEELLNKIPHKQAIIEARQTPNILHYTGSHKPWSKYSNHPLRNLYQYYRQKSPWKVTFVHKTKRFFSRVEAKLKKSITK